MGRLIGIARAASRRAELIELPHVEIGFDTGVAGDARGRTPGRQVTILFREGWEAACRDLGAVLPWTTRRANLLVEGIAVPRIGERLAIGTVALEVTAETDPCRVMEAAHRGLRAALTPEWRGGVCCRVRSAGTVSVGDLVNVVS
jgi:MOSC domain-containing protein YiiM